jgi:hypothetical protein
MVVSALIIVGCLCYLALFEIALVLVRLDHVASVVVKADHKVM